MLTLIALWFFVAVALSWVLTGLLRRYAISNNLLDIPNKRSSHIVPIPRGGGLAIAITFLIGLILLFITKILNVQALLAMAGAGLLVASIGFADDHVHLAPKWRLMVHFIAAFWALAWLGRLPELSVSEHFIDLGWIECLVSAIALVWLLNLFNFMDGIDGIAASEAIFIACGGLFFASHAGNASLQMVSVILIGSLLGFLIWNWPPARIFMGDVGSGFLGITLGIYAYWEIAEGVVSIWPWLILFGGFVLDATVTLIRRIQQGQIWYEAHRSHAYQHAAQRWGHLRVTLGLSIINILWLFPMAYIANVHRAWGGELTLLAYLPLVVLILKLGAGKEMNS